MIERPFTAEDSAAVRVVVYAEPAIAAVRARLDALGPATPNDITDRNTEIHRLERELRALLIPAYRRALIAAGWIEDEEGR